MRTNNKDVYTALCFNGVDRPLIQPESVTDTPSVTPSDH